MRISKSQAAAVFSLIKDELNTNANKEMRRRKKHNRHIEAEALEKFKDTPECAAFLLLKKFDKRIFAAEFCSEQKLANLMFNVYKERLSEFILSYYDEVDTIELLAIDCKNMKDLLDAITKHYNLKNKPTIAKYKCLTQTDKNG